MRPHDKNDKKSNYLFLTKSEFQLLNEKADHSISKNFEYK